MASHIHMVKQLRKKHKLLGWSELGFINAMWNVIKSEGTLKSRWKVTIERLHNYVFPRRKHV